MSNETTTQIQHIDPTSLLVDVNVRTDLNLNPEFIASIKDHGVLVPIVAVATDDGLRVRMGHRRTRAATEAGLSTVPVHVVSTEATGDDAEIERVLTQHAENHHRAGLTITENAGVAKQLSLLGLSASQIAKRTQTKKAHVETALTVAGSELATKATDRYDLTLDQAAVLAEFEDDTDTVTALVAAATTGRFDHVAQRARNDRAEAEAKAPVIAALEAEGVTVIARPAYDSPTMGLNRLTNTDGDTITAADHRECPGHAVFLTEVEIYTEPDGTVLDANRWGEVDWPEDKTPADDDEAASRWEAVTVTRSWTPESVCTDPKANSHRDRYDYSASSGKTAAADMSDEDREAVKAARKVVIENNKAWKAAREVRAEWVKIYLTRKTLSAQAGPFLAHALTADAALISDSKANGTAAAWFSVEPASYGNSAALTEAADAANDKRALVIALGAALAGYEARSGDGAWRENGDHSPTGRYLRFLATIGYTLSEVEEYAASDHSA